MKALDHAKIHKKMIAQDKLYGTTTVGTKGQVVIPAQARADLKIKPGDQLLVMGKFGKIVGLMKAEQLEDFVKTIMGNLAGTGLEAEAQSHFKNFFGKLPINKKNK